jgi:membrane-associated protease RseP (regulator of RpoE activity)
VGIFWVGHSANAETYWEMWPQGALFAVLLLAFLATHEFGHYFAAVYHNVKVSLPYFIPIPIGIGTMGAVIKIEESESRDTKKLV